MRSHKQYFGEEKYFFNNSSFDIWFPVMACYARTFCVKFAHLIVVITMDLDKDSPISLCTQGKYLMNFPFRFTMEILGRLFLSLFHSLIGFKSILDLVKNFPYPAKRVL